MADTPASPTSLRPVDWLLIALTWPVVCGLAGLFTVDVWRRMIDNAPLPAEITERALDISAVTLLAAAILAAIVTLADRWQRRHLPLTALVVWPGLPIAAAVMVIGLGVMIVNSRTLATPIELLANPIASHGAVLTYMAPAMAALVFGTRDPRLVAAAAAPVVLFTLPYLLGEVSIAAGVAGQLMSLAAIAAVCGLAALLTGRAWPLAAASGTVIFTLALAPVVFGYLTPTEAMACVAALTALVTLIVRGAGGAWHDFAHALAAGAREMAGIAAAIGCSGVLPALILFAGGATPRGGPALLQAPDAVTAVAACVVFVVLACLLTPLLAIAMLSSLPTLLLVGGPAQSLQRATLAATVSLGLCAMALRQAWQAAGRGDTGASAPAHAMLSARAALALAAILFAIGLASALYLPRIAPL